MSHDKTPATGVSSTLKAFIEVAERMAQSKRADDEETEVSVRMTQAEVDAMRAGGGFGALVKDSGDNREMFAMGGLTVGDWKALADFIATQSENVMPQRVAHSKSEYKRLSTLGADVLPPNAEPQGNKAGAASDSEGAGFKASDSGATSRGLPNNPADLRYVDKGACDQRTPTPRTDAEQVIGRLRRDGWYSPDAAYVPALFARQLERELESTKKEARAAFRALYEARDAAAALTRTVNPDAIAPCCGEYAVCGRACTPRGKWLAQQSSSSARSTKLPFMARMALVSARDYLMWLVELNGIKKGAVGAVREAIDKAIAEDDSADQSAKSAMCPENSLPCTTECTGGWCRTLHGNPTDRESAE